MNNSTIKQNLLHTVSPGEYIFPTLGSLITVYAIISNSKLLYKQRSISAWFDKDGPLLIGILLANTLSSVFHLCSYVIDMLEICQTINIMTSVDEWIMALADMGALISTLYIGVLSMRSYFTIRAHYKAPDGENKQKRIWILVAHGAWPFSMIFASFGINADHSAIFKDTLLPHLASDVVYYIFIVSLQIVVLFSLLKTKQYTRKVQNDFVVNRAQQSLKTRVSLNRTIKRTKILIPQLAINVSLWLFLLGMNFIVDVAAEGDLIATNQNAEVNTSPIWASCLDCIEALIYLIFPMLLARNPDAPIKQQILKSLICHYDHLKGETRTQPGTVATINGSMATVQGHDIHWKAMDKLWEKVETTKGMAKSKDHKSHTDGSVDHIK